MVSDRPEITTITSHSHLRKRLVLGIIALALIGLIGYLSFGRKPQAATIGITDRLAVDLKGLDTLTETDGSCFRGYTVETIGRDSGGGQHYGLTLELLTDPATDIELIATLAEVVSCQEESAQIATTVTLALHLTESRQSIQVSYRTKNGQRFILP